MNSLIATPFGPKTTADEVLDGVDLTGRTYLVTGGASGIGAETVRALARAGGNVVIGTRRPEQADMLLREFRGLPEAGDVSAAELDLADLGSVDRFVENWSSPLDAVIANAGIMALPRREESAEHWELQLATNYLGHFALMRGLRPQLAASSDGRVAIVSSTAHLRSPMHFEDPNFVSRPYDRWAAYAQSKTADVLLAVGIAERWAGDGITANALMPGWITTNLQRHLDDDTLRALGAMNEAGERIEQSYFKTPAQGAATSVLVAASPLVSGVTGRYFEDNQEAATIVDTEGHSVGVAAHALDREAAQRLWVLGETTLERREPRRASMPAVTTKGRMPQHPPLRRVDT
ncbi:SDR family NAD(P)-dependent oxidoreductase [Microbacterium sp. 3J1]|uniref:SDR family NAD(P)-dependent oxidoreductase n=1 Tax=Microbacterium sp. 3J1 TaxID=861269 RepID=UPI000A7C0788|nr:SDR family NAD(P)-dependent oxidoreductase [Microbacterium sp. 3J1]